MTLRMSPPKKLPFLGAFLRLRAEGMLCRGCLGQLDAGSEAGLCGRCWAELRALPEGRCPRCALLHDLEAECPEPVNWAHGDGFFDYHAGRPALGAMLMPGIKAGEWGWRAALLKRASATALPIFVRDVDLITPVPSNPLRKWKRGFDLAEDFAEQLSRRLEKPLEATLRKSLRTPRQTGRPESQRRRLPQKSFRIKSGASLHGKTILLVDDVWTTGTTLLRCAQLLTKAGAAEIRVLTLFRAF